MTAPRRARGGGAVPLVLLLVLALTALGHAAFLVSLEEQAASTASVAVVQARLLSEGAVRRIARDVRVDTLAEVGGPLWVLAEEAGSHGGFHVSLRRLTAEIYRIDGVGSAALARGGPQRVVDRTSRLLWALNPVERLRAIDAVVEHGGALELAPGAVDTLNLIGTGELDAPAGCRDLEPALDSVVRGRTFGEAMASLSPVGKPLPELGFLDHDTLLARVEGRAFGSVHPAPVVDAGMCVLEAASNWGSPSDPGGPCGGHRPAIASEDALTIVGGEGQGLLLVAGDLRLSEAARYAGLVLVGGDLTLDGSASLEGIVRVRGRVRVDGGAQIRGALCPALLALRATPALRRPLDLPGGGWLRPW